MSTVANRKLGPVEIVQLIPHRHPFLWIDAVEIVEVGKWAKGIKAVTISESIFQGHFPNRPIFPGVLITEALAQTGAVLLNHEAHLSFSESSGGSPNKADAKEPSNDCGYLARVDLKFLRPVLPGQTITLDVKKMGQVQNMFLLNCVALVEGMKVAEGKISVSHPAGGSGSSC